MSARLWKYYGGFRPVALRAAFRREDAVVEIKGGAVGQNVDCFGAEIGDAGTASPASVTDVR